MALATGSVEFTISRELDAPRDLVWKVWTEPKHVAQWWGPDCFTNPVVEIDLRVGGSYRFVLRSPEGQEFPLKGKYLEIEKPSRLVTTIDASEHPVEWHDAINPDRPKDQPTPAMNLQMIVTFEDMGGRTKVTVSSPLPSREMLERMIKIGMQEGWRQSLERLAEEIVEARGGVS